MVQGGGGTTSNGEEPASKQKLRSPVTARNHISRDFQLQQVAAPVSLDLISRVFSRSFCLGSLGTCSTSLLVILMALPTVAE